MTASLFFDRLRALVSSFVKVAILLHGLNHYCAVFIPYGLSSQTSWQWLLHYTNWASYHAQCVISRFFWHWQLHRFLQGCATLHFECVTSNCAIWSCWSSYHSQCGNSSLFRHWQLSRFCPRQFHSLSTLRCSSASDYIASLSRASLPALVIHPLVKQACTLMMLFSFITLPCFF